MVNSTWSRALNQQLTAKERTPFFIISNRASCPRPEALRMGGQPERQPSAAQLSRISTGDESCMPGSVGTGMYPICPGFEAVAYGIGPWSKSSSVGKSGRTKASPKPPHWWPIFTGVLQKQGIEPDPQILAYATTYENKRADLSRCRFHIEKPSYL